MNMPWGGRASSFVIVYRRHRLKIRGWLLRWVTADEADEIMQDLAERCVVLERSGDGVDWEKKMWSLARQLVWTRRRAMRRRKGREKDGVKRSEPETPDELLEARRLLARLNGCPGLTDWERTVVRLFHVEGWSVRAIAARFDLTPAGVRSVLRRGMEKLRGARDSFSGVSCWPLSIIVPRYRFMPVARSSSLLWYGGLAVVTLASILCIAQSGGADGPAGDDALGGNDEEPRVELGLGALEDEEEREEAVEDQSAVPVPESAERVGVLKTEAGEVLRSGVRPPSRTVEPKPAEPEPAEPELVEAREGTLTEELGLLKAVERDIRGAKCGAATEKLDEYARRFPRGQMRDVERIHRQRLSGECGTSGETQ